MLGNDVMDGVSESPASRVTRDQDTPRFLWPVKARVACDEDAPSLF